MKLQNGLKTGKMKTVKVKWLIHCTLIFLYIVLTVALYMFAFSTPKLFADIVLHTLNIILLACMLGHLLWLLVIAFNLIRQKKCEFTIIVLVLICINIGLLMVGGFLFGVISMV